jgi:hypothetical protein
MALRLDGEYIVEVGSERFRLKPGDSILGPREIPHSWAFAGGSSGKLLIAFAPANKTGKAFDAETRRRRGRWGGDIERRRFRGCEGVGVTFLKSVRGASGGGGEPVGL